MSSDVIIRKMDENQINIWLKAYEVKSASKRGFDVSLDENHIVLVTTNILKLEVLHLNGDGVLMDYFVNSAFKSASFATLVSISQDSSSVYFTGK